MRPLPLPLAILASVLLLFAPMALAADAPIKVVYHLNEGPEQASRTIRFIRNHLAAEPGVKIVVVTHAEGIDFLLEGAMDKHKNPYNVAVEELSMQGVEFRVCNLTLQTRKLDKSKLLPEAKLVPSGVAELARLQAREGYVYIRP